MTKDVLVSVRGTQLLDDEEDTIEIIIPGLYYERNGKDYLLYDEALEEAGSVTHNTVKITPGKVEVLKRGLVESRMTFEYGKKHVSSYYTPMGPILLGVTTRELAVEKGESLLRVRIEYLLEMNGEFVSSCRMEIQAGSSRAEILNLGKTEERK